ncbi:MAG: AAA family ATPase [Proteobacteria bacterium]|nr:AAA family ATPase [Pseudomonadota bacterium]
MLFIEEAQKRFGSGSILTRDDIERVVTETGISYPYFFVSRPEYRAGRGQYKLPVIDAGKSEVKVSAPVEVKETETVDMAAQVLTFKQPKLLDESEPSVPSLYPDYVPFGFYKDLNKIIGSKQFYPVFVTGLSGNGKTLMVEQVCAALKRECIRVNISIETDETDLLGGPTLVNGNVVNRDGPVIIAMKRGAILLIDEVDRGSNKLMCLQGILEGKPYFNKKNGEMVYPAPGFNVIATANTKGQGSDEGKFLAQILDSAFLERFPITVEQEFPDMKTEKKILSPLIEDKEFVELLVQWADVVRKTYQENAIDEIISTRRLVHIANAYKIFGDRVKAITLCVNRFDEETKIAFIDLYTKIDAKANEPEVVATSIPPSGEIPF